MPPKVKYQKEEIIAAALALVREEGAGALTARKMAAKLGASTRPLFSGFESMEDLRRTVYDRAKEVYRGYVERGLAGPIPFFGVWQQYLRFAREEKELYRLLFLTPPVRSTGGALEAMAYSRDLARPSLMRIYRMNEREADSFFRDLWLVAFSFATLIVTDNCPYTDEEMLAVGTEISLSVCKAYKEVPGLPEGNFDRDAIFRELVKE